MADEKPLLLTATGEPYQPARLYYQVFNRNAVLGRFKRLKCIRPEGDRWWWLYGYEASSLPFPKSYNSMPKSLRPVKLGYFHWRGADRLLLDVFSMQRVTTAIQFFDAKINRRLACVSRLRVVNQCFDARTGVSEIEMHPSFDVFFDRDDVYIPDPEAYVAEMETIAARYENPDERVKAITDYVERQSSLPVPTIEEVPIFPQEPAFADRLAAQLVAQMIVAVEHLRGNTRYTRQDAIQALLHNPPLDSEDF